MMGALLIERIGRLQTATGNATRGGAAQAENLHLDGAYILIQNGRIAQIGQGSPPELPTDARRLDAHGALATPGLVDAHTHLVFGGWRQHELAKRLQGATYQDILRAGGGILDTVRHTRETGEDALAEKAERILADMLARGVTCVEAKSGYGLNLEDEMKQLRVVRRLAQQTGMTLVPTFMGAHAVPEEYAERADAYVAMVCAKILPEIAREGLASFCDAFCDAGAFTVPQCERVLAAAKALGMGRKLHADELERIGGAELAAQMGAISAEHLAVTGENGMRALRDAGVIAVLLPQTSFYLNKPYADAKAFLARGVPIAIASDFNPGSCPSYDLPFAVTLGFLKYGLAPEALLTAVTLNAACAVGMGKELGTLEVGKRADVVLWNAPDWERVCYRFGANLAQTVILNGKIAKENENVG